MGPGLEDGSSMAERNPLDRALADLEAVVLLQLAAHHGERLIGGKIDDCTLQRPRATPMNDFRAAQKRANPLVLVPIQRFYDLDVAEFRMPADFFLPWRCM